MRTNIEKLKEDTKKQLSKEALNLWEAIEWDKEEVGNSKIGFLSIDPSTKSERIAKFINKRVANKSSDSSLAEGLRKKWAEEIREKYKDQVPVIEINKFRDWLVKTFGNKIVPGVARNLTQDELGLRELYKLLTKMLYDSSPEIIKLDKIELVHFKLINFFKNLVLKSKNLFWVILSILILLAVVKYLLS